MAAYRSTNTPDARSQQRISSEDIIMATYESKKYAFSGANLSGIGANNIADGSVDNTEYQFINSLSSNAQTQITGRLQTAGGTMTGSIVFPDNTGPAPAKIQMGAGTDLKNLF